MIAFLDTWNNGTNRNDLEGVMRGEMFLKVGEYRYNTADLLSLGWKKVKAGASKAKSK